MEKPDWRRGDGLRSIKDVGSLVLDTIADLLPINVEVEIDNAQDLNNS